MRSKYLFTSWSREQFLSQNGKKSPIDSIGNIDQHKVIFLIVDNMRGFARETNSYFIPWSRDASLKVNIA